MKQSTTAMSTRRPSLDGHTKIRRHHGTHD